MAGFQQPIAQTKNERTHFISFLSAFSLIFQFLSQRAPFAFSCLRALVWRLISNDVGKPLRVHAVSGQASTSLNTLADSRQDEEIDGRMEYLGFPVKHSYWFTADISAGHAPVPLSLEAHFWDSKCTTCAREPQQDAFASASERFSAWLSRPSQSNGGGRSKSKHCALVCSALTGEVSRSRAGSPPRGNSSRRTRGLSNRHDGALILSGSWLLRGQVSFDTDSLMTKLSPWLKVHTQEFTAKHQEARNWTFVTEAAKRRLSLLFP